MTSEPRSSWWARLSGALGGRAERAPHPLRPPSGSQTTRTTDPLSESWWYRPPTVPAGIREIQGRRPDGYDFARMVWQVCDDCRTGFILKIRVTGPWQRLGYGTRMVHHALHRSEEYSWSTTPQFEDGRSFFPTITSVALLGRPEPCVHMEARGPRFLNSWERVDAP